MVLEIENVTWTEIQVVCVTFFFRKIHVFFVFDHKVIVKEKEQLV